MKTVIITGASSGIGLALTDELARRGYRVAMLARRTELLEAQREKLTGAGREALVFGCDVADAVAVEQAVAATVEAWGPIDLAVANAGIGYPTGAKRFVLEEARAIMRTNFDGMLTLFAATIPRMIERGSGRFVGVASIAGFRGLPGASIYSASKAAMQSFLEAARIELGSTGVAVTVVNPGFIETPMTEKNRFPMPFLVKVDDAARTIANGIERGSREINFPLPMVLMMKGMRLMPGFIYDRVTMPAARKKTDAARIRR